MNKKILIVWIAGTMLACNFLFTPAASTTPGASVPTKEAEQTVTHPDIDLTGTTFVRLHPQDGNLQTLLAVEAQKAAALGQMPTVEFDATWCPPCQAIEEAFKEKNELMLKAYDGAYIIKLDVDEWGWADSELHDFQFDGIPAYFKIDAQGNQTGETIDGNAWGDNIPENMAPPMDKFFHGK